MLPIAGALMPVGSAFTISFELRLYPDLARSPWNNRARATGDLTEDGTTDEDTEDLPDDGTETDTNDIGDSGEDDPTQLPPFDVAVNGIPVSGPVGIALLVLPIALLGWGRLRLV